MNADKKTLIKKYEWMHFILYAFMFRMVSMAPTQHFKGSLWINLFTFVVPGSDFSICLSNEHGRR